MRREVVVALKLAFVLVGTLLCGVTWSADAVVVDRYGNQHKVERFKYQGRQEIEYRKMFEQIYNWRNYLKQ